MEKWLDIEGYEGIYKISNLGNIVRIGRLSTYFRNGKEILRIAPEMPIVPKKQFPKKDNSYLTVNLNKNSVARTFLIHRLVAKAFLPIDPIRNDVNHLNGIKSDNRVENLEWLTRSENVAHAFKKNLNRKGELHGNSIFTNEEVLKIKKMIASGVKSIEIAKIIGCKASAIYAIKKGRVWGHLTIEDNTTRCN